MFWRFGGYANISTIDTILDRPDVSVEDLLDESDLLQELKQQNSKLVEFLREEPVLHKLLAYVVAEKPPDGAASAAEEKSGATEEAKEDKVSSSAGSGISFFGRGKSRSRSKSVWDSEGDAELERQEAQRKKYAYVACEVLSSEVWSITEALLDQHDHLRAFWRYVYRPVPLDPLQAGYFTKVNEVLLDKKTEEMLAFFKSLDGIVPAILQHVDCPMVMDLLLKIISLEKQEGGAGIVEWLRSQDLIPLLLGYLSPDHSSATQTSAGDFLKAIITLSANATTQDQSVIGPNELTRQLVSEKCIKTLIDDMLRGGNPLTVGVGIIIEVIRKNNSDYDTDDQAGPEPKTSDPIYLGTLLRQFALNVPNFMHLIRSQGAAQPSLKAAHGAQIEPLGFDRFKTCELMAELLHCSNMGLLNERGAEDDIRKRDAERERLRASGRLGTPQASADAATFSSFDAFGSSVDSHGFHHAERPTQDEMDERSEDVEKLEIQNVADEDGFEKVNVPTADDLPDDDAFDELSNRIERTGSTSPERSYPPPSSPPSQSHADADVPAPLSPSKHTKVSAIVATADSPTTAGVTEQINRLGVDEDTVMTEFGEEPADLNDDESSELERGLDRHPEDRPAPLFTRKDPGLTDDHLPDGTSQTEEDNHPDIDQSVTTIQADDLGDATPTRLPFQAEADGSPVVGDLLKIRFVDHQVVPTILDFFFRFPWNNFLHNVVYDVVQQVFNGTLERGHNRTLALDLFTVAKLRDGIDADDLNLSSLADITERILDGQRTSDASQAAKGMRLGYMGHLTLIAEEVCKFGSRHPTELLDANVHERVSREDWIQYVEGTLTETRDRDNAVLGGVRPQDSMGARTVSLGGGGGSILSGFTPNASSALANAGITPQDSMAMSEGTVGHPFDARQPVSGFGNDDHDDIDEDMENDGTGLARKGTSDEEGAEHGGPFSDDEQVPSTVASSDGPGGPSVVGIPPSRARRQLAARLAMRKRAEDAAGEQQGGQRHVIQMTLREPARFRDRRGSDDENNDYEHGDAGGSSSSSSEEDDASEYTRAALRSRVYEDDDDEKQAGRDFSLDHDEIDSDAIGVGGRSAGVQGSESRRRYKAHRPSTMEVVGQRRLLDDEDDEEDSRGGEGPFADGYDVEESEESSSDEDDLVEIRTRRVG